MLRMEIKPGQESAFETAWQEGASTIGREPANLGQWLSRSDEDAGVYYILSDWTDEPSFRAYETSERHLEHRTRLHPYRSAGSMATMRLVASMTGAAAS
jgi:heme-degrading monooxygenase HmoA